MARRSAASTAAPAAPEPSTDPAVDEPHATDPTDVVAQAGELDVEAWVAAVWDHQHNGGPAPQRTYRTPPAEPVHVDALGAVTAVEHDAQQEG